MLYLLGLKPKSQGRRQGGTRGPTLPQSTCLAPPINKLILLKTAALCLISNFGPPDNRLASLNRLLWRRLCQKQSFKTLKQKLCDALVLGYFGNTCQTKVIADANPYGLAAVLVQIQQGQNRVIAFASRTLSQIERKYSQTKKKAFSLVWACERFNVYLYGADFDLLTDDHKALELIFSLRSKSSARTERWVLRLLPYPYRVIYIAGRKILLTRGTSKSR